MNTDKRIDEIIKKHNNLLAEDLNYAYEANLKSEIKALITEEKRKACGCEDCKMKKAMTDEILAIQKSK